MWISNLYMDETVTRFAAVRRTSVIFSLGVNSQAAQVSLYWNVFTFWRQDHCKIRYIYTCTEWRAPSYASVAVCVQTFLLHFIRLFCKYNCNTLFYGNLSGCKVQNSKRRILQIIWSYMSKREHRENRMFRSIIPKFCFYILDIIISAAEYHM